MTRFNTFLLVLVLAVCGLLVWQVTRIRRDLQQTVDSQQQLFEDILKSNDLLEPAAGTSSQKSTADENSAELTYVRLKLESAAGKALPGYNIELASVASVSQKVQSSDQTDDRGVAFERRLPYGEYWLRFKEDSGWRCTEKILLEFGKPFEQTIIAPDPQDRGQIEFVSELRSEPLRELHWGEIQERVGGNSYAVPYTPEPEDELEEFASLPVLGDGGVQTVGCSLSMSLKQDLKQPNGETYHWRWSLPGRGVLVTDNGLAYQIEESSSSTVDQDDVARLESLEDDQDLRFIVMELSEGESPLQVPAAAGELTIELSSIVARTDSEWTDLLAEHCDEPGPYWLQGNVQQQSVWLDRFLDLPEWTIGEKFGRVAVRNVTIESGQTVKISLRSPQPQ
ncbi:hypothetical protein [Rubinisphaera sp. JC750]|uniref:hypothetical protein n=1 Tax=Rubinisphaera sp. JC750 TaxID=2898658 RepID=UPI001F416AEA|nr:hypothetical protein [Rubinisphaera sp. JC750]